MKGRFIGKDSMGFKHGDIYDLKSKNGELHGKIVICLYDKHSTAWCPYSSLEKILENWTFNILEW